MTEHAAPVVDRQRGTQERRRDMTWTGPFNRRRFLQRAGTGAAGAAAAVALAACRGESTPAPTQEQVKQPKRGGIVRHPAYLDLSGQGFDPHVISAANAEPFTLY